MGDQSHDNVDVRLTTRINFYGPVVMIGSLSISGIGLFFFVLWAATHWAMAVVLSAVLVYGLLSLFALIVLSLVTWLIIRVVVHPWISARERMMEANAQEWRNRLLYADSHFAVVVDADGSPIVHPVFPDVPAPKLDMRSEKDTVLELHMAGVGHKRIAQSTGWTEYRVAQACSEFDKKFGKQPTKLREIQAASSESHLDE